MTKAKQDLKGKGPLDTPRKSRGRKTAFNAESSKLTRQPRLRVAIPSRDFDTDSSAQVGAVVSTRLARIGMSDVRRHRVSWVAGYTFVGNGSNGAANAVLFQSATSTYILRGFTTGSSGMVPIAASDSQLGASYVSDVEKHYARKVIRRMWIHVISLQPSTSNNMMAVIAPFRGGGGVEYAVFDPLATSTEAGNTVTNVSSMKGAFSVDSWQSKSVEISDFVAGGSGPDQNEFDLSSLTAGNVAGSVIVSGGATGVDGDGDIPACFTVAGNCTTSGLQNTKVHQIVIEQEVDYLDYVGGMAQPYPIV